MRCPRCDEPTPLDHTETDCITALRARVESLRKHHRDSWQRGCAYGQAQAGFDARQAAEVLRAEKQGRADDNAHFTEEIMRLEALLP